MRVAYRILASLIVAGVVAQAAMIAVAWFTVLNDVDAGAVFDNNSRNWGHDLHAVIGMGVMPGLSLLLLISSFFVRTRGAVLWAGLTVGVVALQIVLAYAGLATPLVGLLHGLNAFAVGAVASMAADRASKAADRASVEADQAPVAAEQASMGVDQANLGAA